MDRAEITATEEGWLLMANGRKLRVGRCSWAVTPWKFNDSNVEPLFSDYGTHDIAATGKILPDGSLSVTWQFLGGIKHGSFSVGQTAGRQN
jgi:hypothetical protein